MAGLESEKCDIVIVPQQWCFTLSSTVYIEDPTENSCSEMLLLRFLTLSKQTKPHNAVNHVIVSECVLVARHVPGFIHVLGLLH